MSNWSWYLPSESISRNDLNNLNPGDPIPLPDIPFQTIQEGQSDNVFVTWGYHLTHCAFVWMKFQRAVVSGRPIGNYIASLEHVKHCSNRIIEGGGGIIDEGDRFLRASSDSQWDKLNTQLHIKFPSCHEVSHLS